MDANCVDGFPIWSSDLTGLLTTDEKSPPESSDSTEAEGGSGCSLPACLAGISEPSAWQPWLEKQRVTGVNPVDLGESTARSQRTSGPQEPQGKAPRGICSSHRPFGAPYLPSLTCKYRSILSSARTESHTPTDSH